MTSVSLTEDNLSLTPGRDKNFFLFFFFFLSFCLTKFIPFLNTDNINFSNQVFFCMSVIRKPHKYALRTFYSPGLLGPVFNNRVKRNCKDQTLIYLQWRAGAAHSATAGPMFQRIGSISL